jgi:hypothetical protein
MIGSECADWWDEQLKNYKEELEAYVLENPGYWGIAVATVKATGADVAHIFFVDLLRLGEGVAEGSFKGVVQDILRVLSFIPQTKITQGARMVPKGLFSRAVQYTSNLFRWRSLSGGLCVPITIAQAIQRTGHKVAVSLNAIAEAAGVSLASIERSGLNPGMITTTLTNLGIQHNVLANSAIRNFDDIVRLASASDGPIMIGVRGVRAGVDEFHRILVGKSGSAVKIIDRSGVVDNLDDLSRRYNMDAGGFWQINLQSPMLHIQNAFIDLANLELVKRFGILASLSRLSIPAFDFNRLDYTVDFIKDEFQQFVAKRRKKKQPLQGEDIHVVGGKTVTVTAGDATKSTLSGIAKAEYGSFDLWPLIYDLNQDKIGPNPNRLKSGTPLLVLPLSAYDDKEVASARRRAPSWKNY